MIDVSQSTEYFLIISAKPELKLGQRLVDGRIVNVRLRNNAEILVDWPVEKAIVDLSIRMKGDLKRTTGNSLSPLVTQNKDIGAVSQTLLTEVKLRL